MDPMKGVSRMSMTQQWQDVSFVGRGADPGSLWFGEGSPSAHRRIAGSIQGMPRIAPGSTWGAEGEHPWIVCLRKTINNSPRRGRRAPYEVDNRRSLIHEEVDRSEPNYDVERSGVIRLAPGGGLGEPDAARGDPYLGPWVSEAIRFGC